MHRYGRKCEDLTLDSRPGRTNAVAILCCIRDWLERAAGAILRCINDWLERAALCTALHGRKPTYGDEIPRDRRGRFRKGKPGGPCRPYGRKHRWASSPTPMANWERHGEAPLPEADRP